MLTGGMQKLTTLDFPGVVSSIVFTRGCNFRCPYCHNPELAAWGLYLKNGKRGTTPDNNSPLPPGDAIRANTQANAGAGLEPSPDMDEVFTFLRKRQGLIDGLVITGGEPCLQTDLPDFCREVKKLGYKIKLDTNGSRPRMLAALLDSDLLDYVAMDLKTMPDNYLPGGICAEPDIGAKITASLFMLQNSSVSHELRTTCVSPWVDYDNITDMAALAGLHSTWYLQQARLENVLCPDADMRAHSPEELAVLLDAARVVMPAAKLRN